MMPFAGACFISPLASFDRFLEPGVCSLEFTELDVPPTSHNCCRDGLGYLNEFDLFVNHLAAYIGKSRMRTDKTHLFVKSHRDTRKLRRIFDQGEQLIAPGAPSSPLNPDSGPNFSTALQRNVQCLKPVRERIIG